MFVVEHTESGIIDCVIVSLFYKEYKYNNLLNNNLDDYVIYLQEFIKEDILNRMNNNISIRRKIIMRLKELLLYCDSDILNTNDICYFYDRFIRLLGGGLLNIKSSIVLKDYTNSYIDTRQISYISNKGNSINEIINNWLLSDYVSIGNNDLLCSNELLNYPNYLAIRINSNCDIIKTIKINNYKWTFRAAICFNTHYYCLIYDGKTFMLYDNRIIPCITTVHMDNPIVINKIHQYIQFVIYIR